MLLNIGTARTQNSFKKSLGFKIDFKLSLKDHISSVYKRASANLNALIRVSGYPNPDKRRVIMSAFFMSPPTLGN